MNTNRLAVSAASMALALAGAIACSTDNTTSPTRVSLNRPTFDLTGNAGAGELQVCKNGTDATFSVTFGGNFNNTQIAGGITPAGGNTYTFGVTAGQCKIIYSRPVQAIPLDPNVTATVTETAPVGGITFVSVAVTTESGNPGSTNQGARSGTVEWNMFHDARVTFVNAPPPPTGCTYTKGWYRNHGANTILALVDGRSKTEQQAIFDATPGQPDGVTWQGGNNTLNLYQQLLAAINNLGGNVLAGPPAVDAAIAAALAATGGTGLNITLVPGTDVSALIDVLSDFNEGEFAGWPHCAD